MKNVLSYTCKLKQWIHSTNKRSDSYGKHINAHQQHIVKDL